MAEAILRSLRDGRLAGEHAPALTLGDSLRCPLAGAAAFSHFLSTLLSQIASGKAQSVGIVVVAAERCPGYYTDLLRRHGLDDSTIERCVQILDCYSDPLGWKQSMLHENLEDNINKTASRGNFSRVCTNIKDIDALLSSIIDLGTGFNNEGTAKFTVAIDSISHIIKHASVSAVSSLISNLRSHDRLSSIFWLIHTDLHETRIAKVFEYLSTIVTSFEAVTLAANCIESVINEFFLEENYMQAKFQIRLKRRNGRVKHLYEEMYVEGDDVKFVSAPIITALQQSILPKVQFNLQLSDKERNDRENVILPFEHQGKGEEIQIYDGRRSIQENHKAPLVPPQPGVSLGTTQPPPGEIHYLRDSDDEQPDSDEDPDDDLDI